MIFGSPVYVVGGHVGYLGREVAARVSPLLRERARQHGGRIACPVSVEASQSGAKLTLMLDPGLLGLNPEDLRAAPPLAAQLTAHLPALAAPYPPGIGVDLTARSALAAAERQLQAVEDDPMRPEDARARLEQGFRGIAAALDRAGDPCSALAWLGLARSSRYQKEHVGKTLTGFVEALRRDPTLTDAWTELVEFACLAPDVDSLSGVFGLAPPPIRPTLIPHLLAVSDSHDRFGRLDPSSGPELRERLVEIAAEANDRSSVALLCADAGNRAAKLGEDDAAHDLWRRAIQAGSTDPQVADRFSIWLVKQRRFDAAARAMRPALSAGYPSATVRTRLENRLARCERELMN